MTLPFSAKSNDHIGYYILRGRVILTDNSEDGFDGLRVFSCVRFVEFRKRFCHVFDLKLECYANSPKNTNQMLFKRHFGGILQTA